MATAETLHTEAALQVSTHKNLIVLTWTETPAPDQLRECARLGRAYARKHPGGIGMLNLILAGAPKFTNEMRDEAVKVNRDPNLFRLGICDTVLVTGFVGVGMRAFLSTVALLARSPVPTKACGSVADAATWLTPRLVAGGQHWSAGELVSIVEPIITARRPKSGA